MSDRFEIAVMKMLFWMMMLMVEKDASNKRYILDIADKLLSDIGIE